MLALAAEIARSQSEVHSRCVPRAVGRTMELSGTGAHQTLLSTFPQSPPFIPYGGFSPIRLEVVSSTGGPSAIARV